jgi:hypothetical protein
MKKIISIALIALVGLTACKKNKDCTPGAMGATGKTGNANVETFIVNTDASSWTLNVIDYSQNATATVDQINASVMNSGTVNVFMGDGTGTSWVALPLAYSMNQWNYSYANSQIKFFETLSNGNAPPNPGILQFKIVVIPPAVKAANPNLNYNNYDEVKAKFNLQ